MGNSGTRWLPSSALMTLGGIINWYNSRKDIPADLKDPGLCVGLVLQRIYLVTGDDAHYVANGAGTGSNGRTGNLPLPAV